MKSGKTAALHDRLLGLVGRLPAHRPLPTERALQARFSVSRETVRRAVEKLMQSGHVYRKHPFGTFVAPTRRERVILVVTYGTLAPGTLSPSFSPFFMSFIEAMRGADEVLLPVVIGNLQFQAECHRVRELYPRLAAVVLHAQSYLFHGNQIRPETIGVPVFYIGADTHPIPPEAGGVLFREDEILASALDMLGVRNSGELLAIGSRNHPVGRGRWERLEQLAHSNRLKLLPCPDDLTAGEKDWSPSPALIRHLRRMPRPLSIFALQDYLGITGIHGALQAGRTFPAETKLVSVGHPSVATLCARPMSMVEIPFDEGAVRLVSMIMDRLGGAPPCQITLPCRQVHRKTT